MPRKTKELNEETNIKKESKLNKKIDSLIKSVFNPDESSVDDNKVKSVTSTLKKESKSISKNASDKKVKTKKSSATKGKTSKKNIAEKTTAKKSSTTQVSKTSVKSKSTSKSSVQKSVKVSAPSAIEYYDLPYKYNQTVVKVLYQNPTTLFVYWEISDVDIENYKKTYGDNFFNTTRPVLIVHNDTMNYNFEVNINDFANSWYFTINDSKCDYHVELIRKPIYYNDKIHSDYIYITSSNRIESPNNRILFSTNEPHIVYFKNTKNNSQRKVNLPELLTQLNLSAKDFGFPLVRNVYDLYKNIYHIDNVGEFSISLTNPSSGNPSSHSLSSKFI